MTSLVDSLYSLATPELAGNVASRLGEPTANVTRGLQAAMAALLVGVMRKSRDPLQLQDVYNVVTNSVNDGRVVDNPSELIAASDTGSPISSLGSQFVSTVFGDRASAVNDVIARSSGLRANVVGTLMTQFAAPLVLGVLGKRVREGGLNAESFTQLIASERASIERAAAAGLASALGEERAFAQDVEREVRREEKVADQAMREYGVEPEKKNKWFWPTVATVGALALLWAIWPRGREHRVNPADTTGSTYSGGEVANPYAVPPATATARVTLPDGSVLNVAEVGPEGRLVGFLKDPTKSPDNTTWFVLDRMQFESNSATLSAGSDAEVKDIVAILKAYPNAKVRIGGFTDNKGSEAANKRLSRDRARSVAKALEKEGIASDRVSAEGYGSAHPIADNSTEAGRAQNRRIGILVTKK